MNYKHKNKTKMWYKVQELTEQGLNKSQIRRETGLDRATIRNYQRMDEGSFHDWIKQKRNLPKKLSGYRNHVKDLLTKTPYLSAAQVEDRLKEDHESLPIIHSKTVYNFVQSVREEFHIPKPAKKESRVFEKLPEPPYGKEAQVDFGETWMRTKDGKRKKVYFFAMVLSRSRYKYVLVTDKPFSSQTAVAAHHLAFDCFGGVPREIIYDQDSVFIHDENLGDYLLTGEFSAFCKSQDFKAVFCRKADPQSKGKIENVVKYVKQNFLRGREYVNTEILNRQAVAWLGRTANAKVHSSTKLVPKEQWERERHFLLPLKPKHVQENLRSYKARKDNTLCFKSNYYTLPLGTYKDKESSVLVETKQNELHVYTMGKELICTHKLSPDMGQTIRNTDHKRQKSQTLETLQRQVLELFGKSETAENYLQTLRKEKSRYFRDNLQYILKEHGRYQGETIRESLLFCTENKVFNAKDLIVILNKNQKEKDGTADAIFSGAILDMVPSGADMRSAYDNIEKSDINKYEEILG
jgi:transposase